jgi:ABC-type amino acid transport substrate-binding protein
MKKLFSIIALVIMSFTTFTLAACSSSNVFTYVIDESFTEYITMGTSADYAPYEWPMNVGGKQTIVGIDIEIAKHIAQALGKNLKVVNKSFDFLLDDLQSGKVDFVMAAMTPTEARAQKVDFSNIYYEATQVLLIQTVNLNIYSSIDSLNLSSKRVGAQMGSIQADLLAEFFPNSQATILAAVPDLALRLQQGQLDGLIVEKPVADGYVINLSGLSIAPFIIGEPDGGSAVAVQKGNQTLLALINQVIADLISSGTLDDIVAQMVILNSGE